MNRLVTLVIVLLVAIAANAQKADRDAQRQQQKRLAAMQDSISHVNAVYALENQDFVLKADHLQFKRGTNAFVSSTTNFVSLTNDKAVVQVASYKGGGPNGIGGVTVEGRASGITIKKDKKGTVYFSMNVSGIGISASVRITLYKNSNDASVDITPNFHSNRITLRGKLLPFSEGGVFKGTSL